MQLTEEGARLLPLDYGIQPTARNIVGQTHISKNGDTHVHHAEQSDAARTGSLSTVYANATSARIYPVSIEHPNRRD